MKNNSKFLFLVLAVPLLAGCGNKVKEPKFAALGEEKAIDAFEEAIEKSLPEDHELVKDDVLGSLVIKAKGASLNSAKHSRGKTVTYEKVTTGKSTEQIDYDATNVLLRDKGENVSKAVEKDAWGKVTTTNKTTTDAMMQEHKVKDVRYAIAVNNVVKEYSPIKVLVDDAKMVDYLSGNIKMAVLMTLSMPVYQEMENYASADEEEQKNYKFYQNGNIFSVVYESKFENKEVKNLTDDSIRCVGSGSEVRKVQVDFTAGAYSLVTYSKQEGKYDYKTAYETYAVGDVYEYEVASSNEFKATRKEPGLKAIDLAKYAAIGFPEE